MDAKELRIGNLFQEKYTKEIIEVDSLEHNKIYFTGTFIGKWQCEPIPLTEEWLFKFGFEDGVKCDFYFNEKMDLSISGYDYDYNGLFIGKIEYVHQLQNLYFALIGDELKIN